MLKILHLINSFNKGDVEKWLLYMLGEIPRIQYEIDFCCKGANLGVLAQVAQHLNAKVICCPLGINQAIFAQQLRQILQEGGYDILHNHLQIYSGLPVWVANQLGIPAITSFHKNNIGMQKPLNRLTIIRQMRSVYAEISVRYAVRHSHLITGCSQGVINSLDSQITKLPKRPCVLNYGIAIPDLSTPEERHAFRKSFGWLDNVPIILHVGRFIEQKNHLGLLSIFKLVLKHIPTAKLLLVGEGPLHTVIERSITQRQLDHAVYLLGAREDLPLLMSKCDIFLLPSLHEDLPVVALEANAAGLPVIGSKIPAMIEAVVDGKTAILHDVADIEGMAKSAIALLHNRQYCQQLGNAGRKWVTDNYSTSASAKQLMSIYDSVIES
ncbi:glycosyltransferase family 4 protein [Calothrix sp. PCC 7507]|uniref:glycosyltransferase family 4 protein n=1 Tax=Calothrix sp. PCC 7507 TaxID=99598 RepID=UPI00029F0135|nr:glycosyltransferase family 4 protein [Calothrix sp. PCC 7507]AFY30778.1 glycosyl transferase group 1 [Calothrix sp. PCC 7507]